MVLIVLEFLTINSFAGNYLATEWDSRLVWRSGCGLSHENFVSICSAYLQLIRMVDGRTQILLSQTKQSEHNQRNEQTFSIFSFWSSVSRPTGGPLAILALNVR